MLKTFITMLILMVKAVFDMVKTGFDEVTWQEIIVHALLALLMALAVEGVKELVILAIAPADAIFTIFREIMKSHFN